MADPQTYVHVVSKHDVKDHAVFPLAASTLAPLAESSVRVHTQLISLTANNLTYALGGHRLHWWDTFPVPPSAPEPYSDSEAWGIVPAWGYGEVVSSTIANLPSGTLLWGYWPTSSLPVDLQLEAIGTDKLRWCETSTHRQRLMNVYQMYEVVSSASSLSQRLKATYTLYRPQFSTGYHLNRHVFPRDSHPQIHPLGQLPNVDLPWTRSDADLTSAVVVCLASRSKTAQPFLWQFLHDRDLSTSGPRAMVLLSSTPDLSLTHPTLPLHHASYTDLTDPSHMSSLLSWMTSHSPRRTVTIDFGAPYSVVQAVQTTLETSTALPVHTDLSFIMVGTKPPPPSPPQSQSQLQPSSSTEKIRTIKRTQFNTSGVRDVVLTQQGVTPYFDDIEACFTRYLRDTGLEDEVGRVPVRPAFGGDGGIEGAWEDLLAGRASGLMVFEL